MGAMREPVHAGALVSEHGIPLERLHVGRLRHEQLVQRCGGVNPPAAVQVVWQLLFTLPEEIAAYPGSGRWREQARLCFAGLPMHVELSRKETQQALRFLAVRGLLPEWVRVAHADAR